MPVPTCGSMRCQHQWQDVPKDRQIEAIAWAMYATWQHQYRDLEGFAAELKRGR